MQNEKGSGECSSYLFPIACQCYLFPFNLSRDVLCNEKQMQAIFMFRKYSHFLGGLKINVCSNILADFYNTCLYAGNVAPVFISGGYFL